MTIKRRLAISNILMIIIPVLISIIVVISALIASFIYLTHRYEITFFDSSDFQIASHMVVEVLEGEAEKEISDFSVAENFLKASNMAILVEREKEEYYSYGIIDNNLLSSARFLSDRSLISEGLRNLYREDFSRRGISYTAFISASNTGQANLSLERVLLFASIILIISIILSVYFTNRILIRFIFRNIEAPLGLLIEGFDELKKGNLDYKIEYNSNDEFTPAFDNFNLMAEKLKESVEITKAEDERSRSLMASLSHDLRSPLTSIKAYVEGLIDGIAKDEGQKQRYLMTIKSKSEELEMIVSRILAYTRLDRSLDIRDDRVQSLDNALSDFIADIKDEYQFRGLDIRLSTTPLTYKFDTYELKEIIINIADNSLKYKNKEIAILEIIQSKDKIIFKDNGPGVKEEDKEKIFDLFFRESEARSDRKGSGIGLALVKKAAKNMECDVKAYNGENDGLLIELVLKGEKYEGADN